jgi:hypothetical protein
LFSLPGLANDPDDRAGGKVDDCEAPFLHSVRSRHLVQ